MSQFVTVVVKRLHRLSSSLGSGRKTQFLPLYLGWKIVVEAAEAELVRHSSEEEK